MTNDVMVSGQGHVQKHDGKSGKKKRIKRASTLSKAQTRYGS